MSGTLLPIVPIKKLDNSPLYKILHENAFHYGPDPQPFVDINSDARAKLLARHSRLGRLGDPGSFIFGDRGP